MPKDDDFMRLWPTPAAYNAMADAISDLATEKDALVREFVRIVQELGAHYFVFENVKGLTLGPHRKFLAACRT